MTKNSEKKPMEYVPSRAEVELTTTEQPTWLHLIDKVADVAIQNQAAGLVLASAIATSIMMYVIAKSAAELIHAWRNGK